MNKTDRYRINESKVIFETFDDEIVLINQDNGNYYSLVTVGAFIWELVQKELSMDEILQEIHDNYTGNRSVIEPAVHEFLVDLQKEDLVYLIDKTENKRDMPGIPNDGKPEKPPFEAPIMLRYTDMQDLLLLDPIHEVSDSGWPDIKQSNDDKK